MSDLSHVFFVPYDNHGLEHFMKDIASLVQFKKLFNQVKAILIYFYKANKQLSILKEY